MHTPTLLAATADFLSGRSVTPRELPLLRQVIREHDAYYYEHEAPIISDAEYDQLYKLLV